MLTWSDFEALVRSRLGRDISPAKNPDQHEAVGAPCGRSLFLVAGPGSGKTTVLALRVLKLVYVDGESPGSFLVTTFTRKAAAELRSRILGWGDQLRQAVLATPRLRDVHGAVRALDFNAVRTGTLDSIAEEVLSDHRPPGATPPVVVEDFVASALMTREGLLNQGRYQDKNLEAFVVHLRGTAWNMSTAEKARVLLAVKDRFVHDGVNVPALRNGHSHPGLAVLCDAVSDYERELENRFLFDFARLEDAFLSRLCDGSMTSFLGTLRHVFVDEYQDTNLLQESIYHALGGAAVQNGGGFSVVGDDDQSLYRFRGATVDLFQDYEARLQAQLGIQPRRIFLSRNYRSTPAVVGFCNGFAQLDREFQSARVAGKPSITPARTPPPADYPVLGLFRDDVHALARDLARVVDLVVNGAGLQVPGRPGLRVRVSTGGSAADVALLCSTPAELKYDGTPRLPALLRDELGRLPSVINVFNPRGQSLEQVPNVQRLCGLLLECVDPGARVLGGIASVPSEASERFDAWRREARRFIATKPRSRTQARLHDFVDAWQNRRLRGHPKTTRWPREVPLLRLVYNLVSWLPEMQTDVEGVVHLEAVTRTFSQAANFSDFEGAVVRDPANPGLEDKSIKDAYRNILIPLATGAIDLNEDLLETLPRDRLSVMSVHQAKGLEFPLTIVDVGSDFKTSHPTQAFKRYPAHAPAPCRAEDEFRPFSGLAPPRRSGVGRAFDDLTRQFFVGFSRAQDVLLLVGTTPGKDGYTLKSGEWRSIANVATGWDRKGTWHWGQGLRNLVHL